jgi:hypothetical protein
MRTHTRASTLARLRALALGLVLLLAPLLGLAQPALAAADAPIVDVVRVDERTVSQECGFPVEDHVEGTIRYAVHFDQDGTPFMEILNYRLRETYTNLDTGESIFTPEVGIDRFSITRNGDRLVVQIGIVIRIVVPGQGAIFAHVGRLVFNIDTREVVFAAGPDDSFDDLGGAICGALAP